MVLAVLELALVSLCFRIRRIKRVFEGAGGCTASHRQEGVELRFESESSVQSLVYCLVFNVYLCADHLNTCKEGKPEKYSLNKVIRLCKRGDSFLGGAMKQLVQK